MVVAVEQRLTTELNVVVLVREQLDADVRIGEPSGGDLVILEGALKWLWVRRTAQLVVLSGTRSSDDRTGALEERLTFGESILFAGYERRLALLQIIDSIGYAQFVQQVHQTIVELEFGVQVQQAERGPQLTNER